MKANELMIGDWVAFRGRPYQYTAQDIATMAECEEKGIATDTTPIPITSEILEKNGFQYTNEHTLKGADTYILRIEQRGYDLRVTIKLNDYIALDSYDDRMYRLAEIQTGKWYVHDLQHALRLCGIEKEIVL